MDIVISLDKIVSLFQIPADIFLAKFMLYFGWLPLAIVLLWGIWQLWLYYIQEKFASKRTWILLAIDIPTSNEQTPKAIEQMFAYLAGAHTTNNLIEDYWIGKTQDWFSFEIVSIDGYTQFLIWTMPKYRDLIESMIYAQYPDSEIAEVDDYTQNIPDKFPNEDYDVWGGEWVLKSPEVLPIRTYLDFEHQFSGDFKDPMSPLIELFSSLRKGEQCWYQIIVIPTGFDWEKKGATEISKIIGEKVATKNTIFDKITGSFLWMLEKIGELIISIFTEVPETQVKEEKEISMINLKPIQKKQIEAIQQKVSKMGFKVKIRFAYVAEKEAMNKSRLNGFVGVMKQFGLQDVNQFKPDLPVTFTSASYIGRKKELISRKNKLISAYKSRSSWAGRDSFILNLEELATIWHFPVESAVKASMLQKIPSRRSEAPSYLPVEGTTSDLSTEIDIEKEIGLERPEPTKEDIFFESQQDVAKPSVQTQNEPPANLPI